MSFQSLHRGVWKVGGGSAAAAVATATCFSSYIADRTSLEVSRRAVVQTQQRFQQHLSALRRDTTTQQNINSQFRFFSSASTSNTKVEQVVAKKIEEAAAPASAASSKRTFAEFYEEHLEKNPLPTKMITGSFLWSVGDAVAQIIPPLAAGSDKPLVYDWARTGRCAVYGFAIHAPASHVHFNFLEYLTNRVGMTGLGIPIFKTVMEQVRRKSMRRQVAIWSSVTQFCRFLIILLFLSLAIQSSLCIGAGYPTRCITLSWASPKE
jgi:hypothetical protein